MIMPSRDIHCILSVPDDQASTDERNEMPFTDMEFVQNFTLPKFLDKNFTPKKSVNHDIFKLTSKQRKCFLRLLITNKPF